MLQPKGIQVFYQLRRQSSFPREDRRTGTKTDPHCKQESVSSVALELRQRSLKLHGLPFMYWMSEQGPGNPSVEECWAHLLGAQQILTECLLEELFTDISYFNSDFIFLFMSYLPVMWSPAQSWASQGSPAAAVSGVPSCSELHRSGHGGIDGPWSSVQVH